MIKGLIFDFDGLILDTETPAYEAWREVFHRHNCTLEWSRYQLCIGSDTKSYSPLTDLENLLGHPVDRKLIQEQQKEYAIRLVAEQSILPGVLETIQQARQRGLKIALASSSEYWWIESNFNRLGLWEYFDCIRTSEDVAHVKPSPELFLSAANCLELNPSETIVFEDSHNGILAAKAAGMFCVAIPNAVTVDLNLDGADISLSRIDAIPFDDLLSAPAHRVTKN
jgi:putative hydrolase of the HAD superfamily